MSTVEQISEQVKQLCPADQQALFDWLENLLEDRLELTAHFKAQIKSGECHIREGIYRTR